LITLVFPSVLPESARYADAAREHGVRTVGASSLEQDPNARRFDDWAFLPLISDPSFFDALELLIIEHGIGAIYTPHAPSFHLFEHQLPSRLPGVRLLGVGPFKRQMAAVRESFDAAAAGRLGIERFAGQRIPMWPAALAGLLAQADRLYGECSQQKILALCAIFADAPVGDVVEIGALYGKSTYVLNRLALSFKVGATLAVDPWNLDLSVQIDAPLNIQQASGGWDWEVVYQGFLLNMLGCSAPPFNYLRATSVDANAHYKDSRIVTSPEFGATTYTGQISVLHIDGNHDESSVDQDLRTWSPQLMPGGWIVFDDYYWPHGNGPRQIADRTLAEYGERVTRHFVGGGAMFIKVSV
jgi:hypothetical protein